MITMISGVLYINYAQSIILKSAGNQLESLSSAKKHRIESLILKKEEELVLVQQTLINAEALFQYNYYQFYPDSSTIQQKIELIKNIRKITKDIPSFKNIHILNKAGVTIASTDYDAIGINFSNFSFVNQSLEGQNTINSFLDINAKDAYLALAGPIKYQNKIQGAVLIETVTKDLVSLTEDYTGLGKTGETVIAQLLSDTVACYITPSRDGTKQLHQIVLDQSSPQSLFKALSGKEQLIFDAYDYNHTKVATSYRYIEKTKWAVITKIDMQEILKPADELKWITVCIIIGSIAIFIAVSILLASSIVSPINQISVAARHISSGGLDKRVNITLKNELGELARSFNFMADSLIDTQQDLKIKIKELDNSNQALEKFAFVVSHDLKSPLNSVLGISEILVTGHLGTLDAEGQKLLHLLKQKVEYMNALIIGILDIARVGETRIETATLDLNELINNIVVTMKEEAIINITNTLPYVKMNKIIAEQLWSNLIKNGIKYNRNSNKKIQIGAYRNAEEIVFTVSDNGIGIDAAYQQSIFEIFKTIAPKNNESTGIGLSIVQKIVESYGGKVWLKSKLDEGSTFMFTLPLTHPSYDDIA